MGPTASTLALAEDAPDRLVLDDLTLRTIVDPDDDRLAHFYAGYDRSFVLASEKETLAGFRECLALNHGTAYTALAGQFGPFREIVVAAFVEDVEGDEVLIGGANFIAFPLADPTATRGVRVALNLNYIFVLPEHRRRGHFGRLVSGCTTIARRTFAPQVDDPPLVFLEQNDPLAMSPADYHRESAHSGLDQRQRIRIWADAGARLLDFPYVQPALSADQEADRGLVLALVGDGADLDPSILREHLTRFFSISVLKGRDAATDADAAAQLADLEHRARRGERLALVDPRPWLARAGEDDASAGILAAIRGRTGDGGA